VNQTATAEQLQPLAPLARVIADTVQATPIRLGTPDGAVDLIQQLIIRVAAYMGSELPTTPGVARHMVEVDGERQRQLAKWGEQHHPDGTGITDAQRTLADQARAACQQAFAEGRGSWAHILMEEVREAYAEADPATLRTELVQCAAVIQAWIHDLDNRA
jgi:hypothetical protein